MHLILFFISIVVLVPFPILYPPIASLTAYFFAKEKQLDSVALLLLYSSGVVTSLIAATITPIADTAVYLRSFQEIDQFDFRELAIDNNGFEPLYKVYELILSFLIGDNPRLFLLSTALLINFLATTAILRICIRLNQYKLPCLILAICYSLVAPALGVPMFLLRSSLSLAILFLGISFYGEIPILFYFLGITSIFIHFSSLLIFGIVILRKYWTTSAGKIAEVGRKLLHISVSETVILRTSLIVFSIGLLISLTAPSLTAPILKIFLSDFGSSGNVASGKAKSFLDAGEENFVDFRNPVVIIQIFITVLCFLRTQSSCKNQLDLYQPLTLKISDFLKTLRLIGRVLIIIIVSTAPLNVLPFRIGFFNFMYFPLWLINVPFLSLSKRVKNYSNYLVLFAVLAVFAYSFYWIPKRESGEYFIVVLENKPLQYNLIKVVEYFL